MLFLSTLSLVCGWAAGFAAPRRSQPGSLRAAPGDQEMDPAEFEKALGAMTAFSNRYVKLTDTTYCSELSVPAAVIRGLAEHKVTLGAPLCPCRFYEDKAAEAKDGYWNCPCVPMRERKECHCMLFLTEDNDFAGDATDISVDEVNKLTS
ncbi:ferredoxin thioredoxin reductase beta subunit, domain-containing protein [Pelagophyceae sp. CCMP2097]|nr:ferredoxin thioredoxin reductase beta subunit, domain-containing protein [Pelagophyceae sp. CCMP2097]